MRKITEESVKAFLNKGEFKKQNMRVFYDKYDNTSRMLLHGNCIATLIFDATNKRNMLTINNCGWQSNTTKERLNALTGVRIVQKNFTWYLNGKEWNGKNINIFI
jgi:hypothetical protein